MMVVLVVCAMNNRRILLRPMGRDIGHFHGGVVGVVVVVRLIIELLETRCHLLLFLKILVLEALILYMGSLVY